MDLDPRLLRYFVAVAEERHFSSQPPLSYAIRQLEAGLGVKLLNRTSRAVTLTEAGRVFYREALSLLHQADDVHELVRRVDAGLRGRLRIGYVGSMLYRGLTDMLLLLRQCMPDVEHVLTELNSNEQVQAVRRGELDLGLIHQNPLPLGVLACELVREPFRLCVPHTHPLAGCGEVTLADFGHEEFVMFARAASPSHYETVLGLCVQAGFTPYIRHEVRHWLGVIGLVARGLGVAIVPGCLASCGLAGAQFLEFAHTAESVSVLVGPGAQATPLQRQGMALVCEFYGVAKPALLTV